MRIQNNTSNYKNPLFISSNRLKKICLETLDEFNKEFKNIDSPYKTYNKALKSESIEKAWECIEISQAQDKKFEILRNEFETFEKINPSYEEKMLKLKELMLKHKVANCKEVNEYYQYMLAKKGVYSEQIGFDIYEGLRNEDHMFPRIKKKSNSLYSFAADAFLNFVEEEDIFLQKIRKYFITTKLNYSDYYKMREINGYKEFLNEVLKNKLNKQNSFFSLLPKGIEFFKRIFF